MMEDVQYFIYSGLGRPVHKVKFELKCASTSDSSGYQRQRVQLWEYEYPDPRDGI